MSATGMRSMTRAFTTLGQKSENQIAMPVRTGPDKGPEIIKVMLLKAVESYL